MRTKPAVFGVVGLVAAALIYWFGFHRAAKPVTKPATVAEDTWGKRAEPAKPAAKPAKPPSELPPLSFETDPDGPLRLEGQVLDADDHPVGGARVRISSSPPRTVETEADGSFAFDKLLGRAYVLTARAGDRLGGPVTTKVVANAEPVVIRLRAGATVTVNVSDATTHKPLAGATVALGGFRLLDDDELNATTGADGKATFRGVGEGFVSITGTAPKYARGSAGKMLGSGEKSTTIELALRTGAPLSGKVVDEQHRGIAGARVWEVNVSNIWEHDGGSRTAVVSGSDGSFTIEIQAVAAGSYLLRATDEAHAPAATAPLTVTGETATTGVEIMMKTAGSLSGVVVSSGGEPVPYASVALSSREWSADMVRRQAAADDHGRFELRALPRAGFKVRAESDDAASKAVEVDLATTADRKDVKLVLDQTGTITGIVVDGAGAGVAEAHVNANPDFLSGDRTAADFVLAQSSATTTDGGRFTLRGLEPGKFRLTAARSGEGRANPMARDAVTASTGDHDVKIVLPTPGGVKGKLVLEGGSAPALAQVSVDWEHRVTVRDGAFELAELAPGKYDLRVTGAEFADKIVRDVEVETGKVTDAGTITIHPGRKITGRVTDSSGQPIEGVKVIFGKTLFGDGQQTGGADPDAAAQFGLRQTSTDRDGAFIIAGAPRGAGSLLAEHLERGRSLAQRIPAGGEDVLGVALTLKSYGSIAGTVTRGGQPVSGATISVGSKGSSGQLTFVTAGPDGAFVIDKVPEGEIGLSAMKSGMMSMQGGLRTVTVIAGQRVDGSIAIPVGTIALTVKIEPRAGATVNAAQVFLFRGAVNVTSGDQILAAFFANQGTQETDITKTERNMTSAAGMLFWLGGAAPQPTFKELTPGPHSACAIPVTGSLTDQQQMGRIMRNLDKLEVICRTIPVTATPTEQTVTVDVPTMRPLPDDE